MSTGRGKQHETAPQKTPAPAAGNPGRGITLELALLRAALYVLVLIGGVFAFLDVDPRREHPVETATYRMGGIITVAVAVAGLAGTARR